jgi:hypothetical protein
MQHKQFTKIQKNSKKSENSKNPVIDTDKAIFL